MSPGDDIANNYCSHWHMTMAGAAIRASWPEESRNLHTPCVGVHFSARIASECLTSEFLKSEIIESRLALIESFAEVGSALNAIMMNVQALLLLLKYHDACSGFMSMACR